MAQEQKQAPGQWRAGQLGATVSVYLLEQAMSRKNQPAAGGAPRGLQQRSLCRIMRLHGAPKKPLHFSSASPEAAPGGAVGCHTRFPSVAPARPFAHSEGKEKMARSQPRLLTCCFHTWKQSARSQRKMMPGAWHSFCAVQAPLSPTLAPRGVSSRRFHFVRFGEPIS
jgi:hypothetical protein